MRDDLKIGDKVIVFDTNNYEEVTFVIGKSDWHWVVLWNNHPNLFKGLSTSAINAALCSSWKIDSKYLGQKAYQIADGYIKLIPHKEKSNCEKCKAFDILIKIRATNYEQSSFI